VVTTPKRPSRGEIWWATLDPVTGSEQAGRRPALIISSNHFQRIQPRLVMVLPMTRAIRHFPFHIEVSPEETGLQRSGVIMCDQIRTISTRRLLGTSPAGRISPETLREVEDLIRAVLEL
jgi:mRNA interferase MazF